MLSAVVGVLIVKSQMVKLHVSVLKLVLLFIFQCVDQMVKHTAMSVN
jgi:hypothetical protein